MSERSNKSDPEGNDRPRGRAVSSRAARIRQRALGKQLQTMFDGVVAEPIPDHLLALLDEIDKHRDEGQQDRNAHPGGDSGGA